MNQLLLLAWPGATAAAVSRLLDDGKLPHLLKLVERGAIADLRPDCAGPHAMTWATVATGRRADEHGVLGDVCPRDNDTGVRWARSEDWRAPALWHWVEAAGGTACVVNWPATHPAQKLNRGAWVSPAFMHAPVGDPSAWLLPGDAVWPTSLREELAALRLHPSDLTLGEVRALIPDAATIDQDVDPRLAKILVSLAANATTHAMATHLAEKQKPDLLAVHFDLLLAANESAHGPAYAQTPAAVLAFYDQMLGRYLQLLGENAGVLITSPGWRESAGILVAAGANIRGDIRARAGTTLDILPIALGQLGFKLPVGFPGSAPLEMWCSGADEPIELPPCELAPQDDPEQSPIDHLIAAGYKPAPLPTQSDWARRQRAVDLGHLSRVKLTGGDGKAAIALAEQAVQLQPAANFIELLARVSFIAGDFARADRGTDQLLTADPQSPAGHLLKAFLNHRSSRPIDPALPATGPAEKLYAGVLALLRGETAAAVQLLSESAEALPRDAGVQHALGLALRASGDNSQAVTYLGRAAALSPRPAIALVHLAQALLAVGDESRAEQSLRRAINTDPGCAAAKSVLTAIIRKRQLQGAASQ